MYVDKVLNCNSPPEYFVSESYRDSDKVKKRTLANISFLTPEQDESFRAMLKGGTIYSTWPLF